MRESLKLLQPSEELAALIGDQPMSPAQAVEELWGYIRENGLQDAGNPRRIKADANLGRIFGGKDQVTVLELARLIGKHLSAGSEGEAIPDEELWEGVRGKGAGVGVRDAGMLAGDVRRGTETEIPGTMSGESPGQAGSGRKIPAGIIKLVEEKIPGASECLRSRGDIPELIPVSSVSPASWETVKKEVGRWEDF